MAWVWSAGLARGRRGDTVITQRLIVDAAGIWKADYRDPRRPHRRDRQGRAIRISSRGVTIVIGPGTEIIAGEGRIVTAGGVDSAYPLHLPATRPKTR
jgi:urease subunit alpha